MAFFLFLHEIEDDHRDCYDTHGEWIRACSRRWRRLSPATRKCWKLRAAEKKAAKVDNKSGNISLLETFPIGAAVKQKKTPKQRKPRKQKALADALVCSICLSAAKNYMCVPCNHVCLCDKCTVKLQKRTGKPDSPPLTCPMCRGKVERLEKVFL